MTSAAVVATVMLAVIVAFQMALALGAPLGSAAWGGQHRGELPVRFRAASAVAALVLYPYAIALVLASAGLVDVAVPGAGSVAMWLLTGFFALGAVANSASRSKPERVWGPVSLVIAVCSGVVAAGGG